MCCCKMCVFIFSVQASQNRYWLGHLNILREQVRDKGGRISRLGVDSTKKANSYANNVYPKNQHMYLHPRDATFNYNKELF